MAEQGRENPEHILSIHPEIDMNRNGELSSLHQSLESMLEEEPNPNKIY